MTAEAESLLPEHTLLALCEKLGGEFVVEKDGRFLVVASVQDAVATRSAATLAAASLDLPPGRLRVVDANTATRSEIRELLQDAVVRAGDVAKTVHGEPLRRMAELHYDVPRDMRVMKDRVNRYVHGYRLGPSEQARTRAYEYAGVIARKGVRSIGQSVLRLPPAIADEVENRLRDWGVPVTRNEVYEPFPELVPEAGNSRRV